MRYKQRRYRIKSTALFSKFMLAVLLVILLGFSYGCTDKPAKVKEKQVAPKKRSAQITMQFNLDTPKNAKVVKLWVPYPVSDENQTIDDIKINGTFSNSGVYREDEYGNMILYAEWNNSTKKRLLTFAFDVKRKEVIRKNFPDEELPLSKNELRKYLKATSLAPITGKVKERAEKIIEGKETSLEKARAIYDWIINNMERDPNVKGCGSGNCGQVLENLKGKCADLHGVYVAMLRSVGVPAREIYGIRLPKEKEGDMTKSQHCWAEFYLPGYGWVPIDASDVRKYMLENKITKVKDAKDKVEYFFGSIDENRIAYQTGRDIQLSPMQDGGKLNYFMYPYAEADGEMLNEDLFGFNLGYEINYKEL